MEPSGTTPGASRRGVSVTRRPDGALVVELAGQWRLADGMASSASVEHALAVAPPPARVAFDVARLADWDSAAVVFIARVASLARARGIAVDEAGIPDGIHRLLALARAVPEKEGARTHEAHADLVERIGERALAAGVSLREMVAFLGEVTTTVGTLLRGRLRYRRADLVMVVQQVGVEALPIVTLIAFLVGAILAFVGAVQLEQFGAGLYVANLVGIAMARDMGAMMTGIVMAGRSGAAFAAQLGSMKVTQEIDALSTMGIPPLGFLVLPRIVALSLMMPLLCLYADAVGILGGAAVGVGMLGISPAVYYQQTTGAVRMGDVVGGLFKATVYGVLIAMAGCLRGMQSGRSSSAVGDATTAAVVTSIVAIITACGVFSVVFYVLKI
jgi:phospholipid/cholesterol/gamma-HCH transport system permease protein